MNRYLLYLVILYTILPLFACQKTVKKNLETDYNSYINEFELIQENPKNDTRIKITSPKAVISTQSKDIEIFDSSMKIFSKDGNDVEILAANLTLNNPKNLIRAYNNVSINLINNTSSFIRTNSLDWDLNNSNIEIDSPLDFNFKNTSIDSDNGSYNIDLSQLKLNNNIFRRSIMNNNGEAIYHIIIKSDMAQWLNNNKSLEFSSNNNQVETIINFLRIKEIK